MHDRTCTVAGCDKPPRSGSAEFCPKHYHRWYRHGSVDAHAPTSGVSVSLGRRYKRVAATGHPLADAQGRAYEHRVVLYDQLGPGAHPCHWCGFEVDWSATRGDPRCLQVDHLNGDGADNRPQNLVPSCQPCNSTRGMQAKAAALRAAGFWSNNDTIANLKAGGRRPPVEAGGG